MTKRLSPERIAHQREHLRFHGFYDDPEEELLGHIDAIEAELKHTIAAWHDSQNELAEAKAEIARLTSLIDQMGTNIV